DMKLVRATIDLGHALGLLVVAEGIETLATLELLALLGCDRAQGYFTGRPVPALEFEAAATLQTLRVAPANPVAAAPAHLRTPGCSEVVARRRLCPTTTVTRARRTDQAARICAWRPKNPEPSSERVRARRMTLY